MRYNSRFRRRRAPVGRRRRSYGTRFKHRSRIGTRM